MKIVQEVIWATKDTVGEIKMDNFAGYDNGYDEFNLTGEYDSNAGS